jgi:hypothetical protein
MGEKEDYIKMNFFLKEAQTALDNAKKLAEKNCCSFEFEGQTYDVYDKQFQPIKDKEYWNGSGGDTWSC